MKKCQPDYEITHYHKRMVGAIGFEPTTYGTQNRRATRLRHAPNIKGGLAFWAEDEKP